ncbi:hypothetical protein GWI33_020924 [Rhynchophorus ferrugineus]|uniref:Uncharacterized protein n=1 Tax=Rhynchophorus ferrugineus TaxID=354439 RepID=A0A834HQ39_RHYFE|nr:hypothetical protein GWI33_020924 [Rhynchophorus ferrugineus]
MSTVLDQTLKIGKKRWPESTRRKDQVLIYNFMFFAHDSTPVKSDFATSGAARELFNVKQMALAYLRHFFRKRLQV